MNATQAYSRANVLVALSKVNGTLLWAVGLSLILALMGVLSWHVGKRLRKRRYRASYLKVERETDSCSDVELFEERPSKSSTAAVKMKDLARELKDGEDTHDSEDVVPRDL